MKRYLFISFLSVFTLIACKHETFTDRCEREAREYTTKQCPLILQEGLTMDSMTFRKAENKFIYYYTLSGKLDNPGYVQNNATNIRKQLLDALTNSVEMKRYKDENMAFEYIYMSQSEKKGILDFTFTKEEYRQ